MLGLEKLFKSKSVYEPSSTRQQAKKKNEELLPNQISGRILDLEM